MKKLYLLLAAVCAAFSLAACGMTAEEITTYMTSLEASYQNGVYEQALDEIETLDKAYNKMSDEQKAKFDELKSAVEYAIESSEAINDGLSKAQRMLDQKMYYEASQELETLSSSYTLPPADRKKFDEKKAAADSGIKEWKAASAMQEAKQLLENGDYDAAAEKLGAVDTASLSQEQQTKYQSLQTGISDAKAAAAKAAAEAEARKNNPETKAKEAVKRQYSGWSIKSTEKVGVSSYYVYITNGERNKRIEVSGESIVDDIEMPGNAQIEYDMNN